MGLRKISTNVPEELLLTAAALSGLNQTQAIIEGLKLLVASQKREQLLNLKGKIHFDLDIRKNRQRKKV